MVIAIDFDNTLSKGKMQDFAKRAIKDGNNVWVVTKRREGMDNRDLDEVLIKIRLPRQKVIFTNDKRKFEFIEGLAADLFIDNDTSEFDEINNQTKTLALTHYL